MTPVAALTAAALMLRLGQPDVWKHVSALPAACLAMISAAKKENKKAVTGMLLGIAFTSFLAGITEPIEFTFMLIAPVLYGIHAVLTGVSLAVTSALGIKAGFGFQQVQQI